MPTTEQQGNPKLPFDKNGKLDTKQLALDIGKFLEEAVNTFAKNQTTAQPGRPE
jgi:hypothetical protein|tara:strand:- start:535 stop:696 length:162 start_codon:yes stop_codon:yes gene_type:complete